MNDAHRSKRLMASGLAVAALLAFTAAAQNANTPSGSGVVAQTAASYDELKQLLKDRYDGKIVAAALDGLYAGEQRKGDFGVGPGTNGIYWSHFAENMQVPERIGSAFFGGKKTSDLSQLDERTFGDLKRGLNLSPIQKGEPLKVYKFYVSPEYVALVLSTKGLEHWRDLEIDKASKQVTTSVRGNQVNRTVSVGGFGLVFIFYFNKGAIKDDHDFAGVLREINKYLLPESEAQELANGGKNIEIEPGMTEEQVIQKLGQPLQSVKFGDQKSLKYRGMTVVLKDGKVVDVKVE